MRCRGVTMMGQTFPMPLIEEKLHDIDKYELLKSEGEEVVYASFVNDSLLNLATRRLHESALVAHSYGVCTEENHLIFGQ